MSQNDYIDKVFNCDCLQGMRRMIDDGVKVDAVITDPPYILHSNAKGDSELCKRLRKKKENIEFITDDFDYKQGFDWIALDEVYEAKCIPFMKDGDLLWIVGKKI